MPVPLTGQSSRTWPALRSIASAANLSSSLNVEASITTRRGTLALTMATIVAASAADLGRLKMMVGAWRATSARNTPFQPSATEPNAIAASAIAATGQDGSASASTAPLKPMA